MNDGAGPAGGCAVDLRIFGQWVQSALRQLYDFAALETHPLGDLLADPEHSSLGRAQELRRLLLETVGAIRPGAGTPLDAPDWRGYRILQMRYIEGLSPDEAMARLALQKSQYYSDQSRALQVLVARLWEMYQARRQARLSTTPAAPETLIRHETDRLSAQASWEEIDPVALLAGLRPVLEPLAKACSARLDFRPSPAFTVKRVDRILLRQAILQAATSALTAFPGGALELSGFVEGGRMGLRLRARGATLSPAPDSDPEWSTRIELSQQLMGELGGRLAITSGDGAWQAELAWEAPASPLLLVVDDNQGFADLFRRYLAGHPWRVGAARGPEARQLIAETSPPSSRSTCSCRKRTAGTC